MGFSNTGEPIRDVRLSASICLHPVVLKVLIGLAFFMFQILIQVSNGSLVAEFGGHPDEAAHYITGLMVRDYIAAGIESPPLEYAENYYLHYPKVAMGHWPPFFYVVQAAWTLLFSPSRVSICLLQAFLTALLAYSIFWVSRKEFNGYVGFFISLVFLMLPLIQKFSGMLMAEILVALLSFWAVLFFARFLEFERWQDALGFGILSTLTILSKGNGLALALIPPLSCIFLKRVRILRNPALWGSAVIVVVFCFPVYWFTLDMVRNTWEQENLTLGVFLSAVQYYSWNASLMLPGLGLLCLAALGFWDQIIKPWREKKVQPLWAAMGSLLIGVWAFHCVVPSSLEDRNLVAAIPALVLFFGAGCWWIVERHALGRISRMKKVAVLAFVIGTFFVGEVIATPKPVLLGFRPVAQWFLSKPEFEKSIVLVSSDTKGEGAFISDVAQAEERPGHIILRASKVLSKSTWTGYQYQVLQKTEEELAAYLEGVPVGVVILDTSIPLSKQYEHHRMLIRYLEGSVEKWSFAGSYTMNRGGALYPNALRVYVQEGHQDRPMGRISIDMGAMLNRSIESSPID